MNKTIWIFFAFLFVGCAHGAVAPMAPVKPWASEDQEQKRNLMIGRWFGEVSTTDGGKRKWLMDRRNDGSYTSTFILQNGAKKEKQIEIGFWGVDGGIYFTMTRETIEKDQVIPLDTTSVTLYDAYKVLDLTSEFFQYQSLNSNETFSVRKVSDKFKID